MAAPLFKSTSFQYSTSASQNENSQPTQVQPVAQTDISDIEKGMQQLTIDLNSLEDAKVRTSYVYTILTVDYTALSLNDLKIYLSCLHVVLDRILYTLEEETIVYDHILKVCSAGIVHTEAMDKYCTDYFALLEKILVLSDASIREKVCSILWNMIHQIPIKNSPAVMLARCSAIGHVLTYGIWSDTEYCQSAVLVDLKELAKHGPLKDSVSIACQCVLLCLGLSSADPQLVVKYCESHAVFPQDQENILLLGLYHIVTSSVAVQLRISAGQSIYKLIGLDVSREVLNSGEENVLFGKRSSLFMILGALMSLPKTEAPSLWFLPHIKESLFSLGKKAYQENSKCIQIPDGIKYHFCIAFERAIHSQQISADDKTPLVSEDDKKIARKYIRSILFSSEELFAACTKAARSIRSDSAFRSEKQHAFDILTVASHHAALFNDVHKFEAYCQIMRDILRSPQLFDSGRAIECLLTVTNSFLSPQIFGEVCRSLRAILETKESSVDQQQRALNYLLKITKIDRHMLKGTPTDKGAHHHITSSLAEEVSLNLQVLWEKCTTGSDPSSLGKEVCELFSKNLQSETHKSAFKNKCFMLKAMITKKTSDATIQGIIDLAKKVLLSFDPKDLPCDAIEEYVSTLRAAVSSGLGKAEVHKQLLLLTKVPAVEQSIVATQYVCETLADTFVDLDVHQQSTPAEFVEKVALEFIKSDPLQKSKINATSQIGLVKGLIKSLRLLKKQKNGEQLIVDVANYVSSWAHMEALDKESISLLCTILSELFTNESEQIRCKALCIALAISITHVEHISLEQCKLQRQIVSTLYGRLRPEHIHEKKLLAELFDTLSVRCKTEKQIDYCADIVMSILETKKWELFPASLFLLWADILASPVVKLWPCPTPQDIENICIDHRLALFAPLGKLKIGQNLLDKLCLTILQDVRLQKKVAAISEKKVLESFLDGIYNIVAQEQYKQYKTDAAAIVKKHAEGRQCNTMRIQLENIVRAELPTVLAAKFDPKSLIAWEEMTTADFNDLYCLYRQLNKDRENIKGIIAHCQKAIRHLVEETFMPKAQSSSTTGTKVYAKERQQRMMINCSVICEDIPELYGDFFLLLYHILASTQSEHVREKKMAIEWIDFLFQKHDVITSDGQDDPLYLWANFFNTMAARIVYTKDTTLVQKLFDSNAVFLKKFVDMLGRFKEFRESDIVKKRQEALKAVCSFILQACTCVSADPQLIQKVVQTFCTLGTNVENMEEKSVKEYVEVLQALRTLNLTREERKGLDDILVALPLASCSGWISVMQDIWLTGEEPSDRHVARRRICEVLESEKGKVSAESLLLVLDSVVLKIESVLAASSCSNKMLFKEVVDKAVQCLIGLARGDNPKLQEIYGLLKRYLGLGVGNIYCYLNQCVECKLIDFVTANLNELKKISAKISVSSQTTILQEAWLAMVETTCVFKGANAEDKDLPVTLFERCYDTINDGNIWKYFECFCDTAAIKKQKTIDVKYAVHIEGRLTTLSSDVACLCAPQIEKIRARLKEIFKNGKSNQRVWSTDDAQKWLERTVPNIQVAIKSKHAFHMLPDLILLPSNMKIGAKVPSSWDQYISVICKEAYKENPGAFRSCLGDVCTRDAYERSRARFMRIVVKEKDLLQPFLVQFPMVKITSIHQRELFDIQKTILQNFLGKTISSLRDIDLMLACSERIFTSKEHSFEQMVKDVSEACSVTQWEWIVSLYCQLYAENNSSVEEILSKKFENATEDVFHNIIEALLSIPSHIPNTKSTQRLWEGIMAKIVTATKLESTLSFVCSLPADNDCLSIGNHWLMGLFVKEPQYFSRILHKLLSKPLEEQKFKPVPFNEKKILFLKDFPQFVREDTFAISASVALACIASLSQSMKKETFINIVRRLRQLESIFGVSQRKEAIDKSLSPVQWRAWVELQCLYLDKPFEDDSINCIVTILNSFHACDVQECAYHIMSMPSRLNYEETAMTNWCTIVKKIGQEISEDALKNVFSQLYSKKNSTFNKEISNNRKILMQQMVSDDILCKRIFSWQGFKEYENERDMRDRYIKSVESFCQPENFSSCVDILLSCITHRKEVEEGPLQKIIALTDVSPNQYQLSPTQSTWLFETALLYCTPFRSEFLTSLSTKFSFTSPVHIQALNKKLVAATDRALVQAAMSCVSTVFTLLSDPEWIGHIGLVIECVHHLMLSYAAPLRTCCDALDRHKVALKQTKDLGQQVKLERECLDLEEKYADLRRMFEDNWPCDTAVQQFSKLPELHSEYANDPLNEDFLSWSCAVFDILKMAPDKFYGPFLDGIYATLQLTKLSMENKLWFLQKISQERDIVDRTQAQYGLIGLNVDAVINKPIFKKDSPLGCDIALWVIQSSPKESISWDVFRKLFDNSNILREQRLLLCALWFTHGKDKNRVSSEFIRKELRDKSLLVAMLLSSSKEVLCAIRNCIGLGDAKAFMSFIWSELLQRLFPDKLPEELDQYTQDPESLNSLFTNICDDILKSDTSGQYRCRLGIELILTFISECSGMDWSCISSWVLCPHCSEDQKKRTQILFTKMFTISDIQTFREENPDKKYTKLFDILEEWVNTGTTH